MRILALALAALLLQSTPASSYRNGGIDVDKNGVQDPYENRSVAVDRRIYDVLLGVHPKTSD